MKYQTDAWDKLTDAFWVYLYRGRYESDPSAQFKEVTKIKNVLMRLAHVEEEEDFNVTYPTQENRVGREERFPHPYHILVSGLPRDRVERLLRMAVISTKAVTFFVVPYHPPRQLFIMTISGLTYSISERNKTTVLELVRKTYRESPGVQTLANKYKGMSPNPMEVILQRMRVNGMITRMHPGGPLPLWSIFFIEDPGMQDDDHKAMIDLMRSYSFTSPAITNGIGKRIATALLCTGCKSVEHDSANCPFSKAPGWMGFKVSEQSKSTTASPYVDDARNTSHRGRGGGGGGRGNNRGRGQGKGNGHRDGDGRGRSGRGYYRGTSYAG